MHEVQSPVLLKKKKKRRRRKWRRRRKRERKKKIRCRKLKCKSPKVGRAWNYKQSYVSQMEPRAGRKNSGIGDQRGLQVPYRTF
jgi:hypothetical protein